MADTPEGFSQGDRVIYDRKTWTVRGWETRPPGERTFGSLQLLLERAEKPKGRTKRTLIHIYVDALEVRRTGRRASSPVG